MILNHGVLIDRILSHLLIEKWTLHIYQDWHWLKFSELIILKIICFGNNWNLIDQT